MKIEKDTVVTLDYELQTSEKQGPRTFVEKTSPENPLTFLFGAGNLLPYFEDQIHGKEPGDGFEFDIDAANGYGEYDKESIVELPKTAFEGADPTLLQPGKVVPMMDNQGHHLSGTIRDVKADAVLMDFNHPLAGKSLHFKGTISDVRLATAEEISHGHVHGKGGVHH